MGQPIGQHHPWLESPGAETVRGRGCPTAVNVFLEIRVGGYTESPGPTRMGGIGTPNGIPLGVHSIGHRHPSSADTP